MAKEALVVDNDFFFVQFVAELLEKRGYGVLKAYDGKEGIGYLQEHAIDILFVDMIMPKIDGKEVIRYARRKIPDCRFPIVALSGTIIERLEEIKDVGADYYMAKGPLEKMEAKLTHFMDRLEQEGPSSLTMEEFFEPENLYPRQETAELIEAVNYRQAVIESVGVGLIVVDKDAKIVHANAAALETAHRELEDLLNRPITSVFPSREKARIIGALKNVIHERDTRRIALSVTIRSKEVRLVVSLFTSDDEIVGWIIAMEDSEQWVEQA